MFAHTLNTWLLAHLFHPFLFFGLANLKYPGDADMENAGFFMIFWIVAFFISIPSFAFSRMALYGISKLDLTSPEKFILWLIAVPVAILINFLGLAFLMHESVNTTMLLIIVPSVLSAIISILIRTRSFFDLQSNYNSINSESKIVNNENIF